MPPIHSISAAPPVPLTLQDYAKAAGDHADGVLVLDNGHLQVIGRGELGGRQVAWVEGAEQATTQFIDLLQRDCGPRISSLLRERFGLEDAQVVSLDTRLAAEVAQAAADAKTAMAGIAFADQLRGTDA